MRHPRAMTLIEILLVLSLVTMISIALYKALRNGLQVWERSRRLVVEEDIAIFFDKMSQDIKNSYLYSKIRFEGTEVNFLFPTIVRVTADAHSGAPRGELVDQLGRVHYFFDPQQRTIGKRAANYSQALKNKFGPPQILAQSIDRLKFRYYYRTDQGEVFSPKVLDTLPAGVDVEVLFSDKKGQRSIHKFIDVPIGI